MTGGAGSSVDGDFWTDLFACHHSNVPGLLPLLLFRWGSMVPMYILLQLAWV